MLLGFCLHVLPSLGPLSSNRRGRKVHDINPLRPQSGIGPHSLGLVSAVCGVWPLMLLGDADGTLMAWDLMHGRCSSIATGEPHRHHCYTAVICRSAASRVV